MSVEINDFHVSAGNQWKTVALPVLSWESINVSNGVLKAKVSFSKTPQVVTDTVGVQRSGRLKTFPQEHAWLRRNRVDKTCIRHAAVFPPATRHEAMYTRNFFGFEPHALHVTSPTASPNLKARRPLPSKSLGNWHAWKLESEACVVRRFGAGNLWDETEGAEKEKERFTCLCSRAANYHLVPAGAPQKAARIFNSKLESCCNWSPTLVPHPKQRDLSDQSSERGFESVTCGGITIGMWEGMDEQTTSREIRFGLQRVDPSTDCVLGGDIGQIWEEGVRVKVAKCIDSVAAVRFRTASEPEPNLNRTPGRGIWRGFGRDFSELTPHEAELKPKF
ncbi:hypothetical protein B0H19DRAFT_1055132 [Mycena capillaripes]|nr:hypothetical protein B0H19DRAFT_1055132 [Mycena capillaripes]